jgi:hypothetical protein
MCCPKCPFYDECCEESPFYDECCEECPFYDECYPADFEIGYNNE